MTIQYGSFEEIEERLAGVDGLLRDGQERFLFETVKRLPHDAVIVQIGSFMGRSTLSMGFACHGSGKKIYSVDTWNGNDRDFDINDFYINWAKNVIDAGLEACVFPLVGHSGVIMPLWDTIAKNKKIDMVFIDGSHVYQDVLADFYHCYDHVKDDGWIFFHDVTDDGWTGPDKVWRELAGNVLVEHVFHSTLGGGRKRGPLPRWAALYCEKVLTIPQEEQQPGAVQCVSLPEPSEGRLHAPRDMSRLEGFLDRIAAEAYPQEPSATHSDITSVALQRLVALFPLGAGSRVLDVGCGQGPALEFFREQRTEYLGITLSDEDIMACRSKGFRVEKMDQSFLTLPGNSQDLVWARHVIEHSVFPLFTLEGFNRVLRPGGMLYLEVPAPETSCHHERNPNHYSVFSKGCWRALIERSGFQVLCDADFSLEVPVGPDLYWGFYCLKQSRLQ